MTIKQVPNPLDESEIFTIISGTVKRILMKEAPATNKFATHLASIIVADEGVDDVFVNIDLTVKEGYEPRIQYAEGKKGSETWHTLGVGDVVNLNIKEVNEWKGKTYYKTTVSRIKVTKKADPVSNKTPNSGSKGSTKSSDYEPYDLVGVMTGHAVGGAARLSSAGAKGTLVELAEIVHTKTTELKVIVAEKTGLSVNSKNVGNSVGNAINAAIELYTAKSGDVSEFLITKGTEIYFEVSQVVYETIQNKGTVVETKKEPVKEKTKVSKPSPTPAVDFDDDIPF